MGLMLNLGLAATPVGEVAPPAGPSVTAPGSTDNATPVVGDTVTITAGTATATGGGAVTYEFRHLVNSVSASAVAGYTYQAADDGESFAQQWRAVETGGTNDDATGWFTVASGTVRSVPAVTASDALAGRTLTISVDTLSGTPTPSVALSSITRNGVDVSSNVTGSGPWSYEVFDPLPGSDQTVAWEVTATNSAGSDTASGSEVVPTDWVPPSVTASDALAGRTLTITVDSLTGSPAPSAALTTLTLDGVDVSGDATGSGPWSYVVPDDTAAQTVAWVITATSGSGSDTASGSEVVAANITAPGAYTAPDWTAAAGGDGEIVINPGTDPAMNNGTLVRREYRLDGGSAVSMALTDPFTITGLSAGATDVQIRAVNEAGAGAWSDIKSVTVTGAVSAPTVTIDAFNDGTDTATITADQDCNLDWALVSGVTWSYSAGTFSGADVLESGDAGAFTVAGGAQAFTPTYTSASATATTLVIGATNGNGDDTATTAFTPNLPPAQMGAPSLVVDSSSQITATLAAAPEGYQNGVDSYDLRYSTDEATWTTVTGITSPHAITGLTASTLYYVQTRGVNEDGAGAWSTSATETTSAGGGAAVVPAFIAPSQESSDWAATTKTYPAAFPDAGTFVALISGKSTDATAVTVTAGGTGVTAATVLDIGGVAGADSALVAAVLVTTSGASNLTVTVTGGVLYETTLFVVRATNAVAGSAASVITTGGAAASLTNVPAGAGVFAVYANTLSHTVGVSAVTWTGGLTDHGDQVLDGAVTGSGASLANGTTQTITTTPTISPAGANEATLLLSLESS